MKRIYILLGVVVTCIGFISCTQQDTKVDTEPYYEHFAPEKKDKDKPDVIEPLQNEAKSVIESDWPYDLDFAGLSVTEEYGRNSNASHYKFGTGGWSLMSYDETNDMFYYINYGHDNYIYSLHEGISTAIVQRPAKNVVYWKDSLYYIDLGDEESSKVVQGIYQYDLVEKKSDLIVEGDFGDLYVDRNGIYYTTTFTEEIWDYYRIAANGVPEKVPYIYGPSYYEYQLLYSADAIYLLNTITQETIEIAPKDYIDKQPFLSEDYFGFRKDGNVYMVNLLDGERYIVNVLEQMYKKDFIVEHYVYDVVIIDEYLYMNLNRSIVRYDLREETGVEFPQNHIEKNLVFIQYIYTDGKELYALVNDREFTYSIVKLKLGDASEYFSVGPDKEANPIISTTQVYIEPIVK